MIELPITLAVWEVNLDSPQRGNWDSRHFETSDYVSAWDQYLKEKFSGKAVMLFLRGELQARGNMDPQIPEYKEVA